ncbi:hypothetical protein CHS0354_006818 [Potamilus streckersoni]|uniref:Uncharacterized protein n=1 Tax=Potamilus streckersoni TaxID=2493646 RepID=A0AAE0WCR5_9BIVA|nr:hypothetical protein CHS0354_006818 [Potamilus streckersoni]
MAVIPGQSLDGDPLNWLYALPTDEETRAGNPVTVSLIRQLVINTELVKRTAEGAGSMTFIAEYYIAGTYQLDLTGYKILRIQCRPAGGGGSGYYGGSSTYWGNGGGAGGVTSVGTLISFPGYSGGGVVLNGVSNGSTVLHPFVSAQKLVTLSPFTVRTAATGLNSGRQYSGGYGTEVSLFSQSYLIELDCTGSTTVNLTVGAGGEGDAPFETAGVKYDAAGNILTGAGEVWTECPSDVKAGWAYDRDGGTFAAPPSEAPPSLEDKLRALSAAVQKVLDDKAEKFGFTDIRSAAGYAANYALGSRSEIDTAGAKLTKWRGAVWQFLDDEKKARTPQQLNDITLEKILTEMPQFSGITL